MPSEKMFASLSFSADIAETCKLSWFPTAGPSVLVGPNLIFKVRLSRERLACKNVNHGMTYGSNLGRSGGVSPSRPRFEARSFGGSGDVARFVGVKGAI